MALTAEAIMTSNGHKLPLARDLREALIAYYEHEYPINTTLYVAKHLDIDKTRAKNLLKGHASDALITHALRKGGWAMAIEIIGSVIGHALDDHIEKEKRDHELRAARWAARGEHLSSRPDRVDLSSSRAADRIDRGRADVGRSKTERGAS